MATKYAKLAGKVPEAPTERETAWNEAVAERQGKTVDQLTAEYNSLDAEITRLDDVRKGLITKQEAVEFLIRRGIEGANAERMTMNGYTWTPRCEPFGSAVNAAALVEHFVKTGQLHMLSVHPSRITSIVKEEANNNELTVEVKKVPGPEGQEVEVQEVRSGRLPGVRVFLKPILSRVKSSKGE